MLVDLDPNTCRGLCLRTPHEAKKAPVQAPPWLRGRVRAAPSDAPNPQRVAYVCFRARIRTAGFSLLLPISQSPYLWLPILGASLKEAWYPKYFDAARLLRVEQYQPRGRSMEGCNLKEFLLSGTPPPPHFINTGFGFRWACLEPWGREVWPIFSDPKRTAYI